jgi:hypothetical protein
MGRLLLILTAIYLFTPVSAQTVPGPDTIVLPSGSKATGSEENIHFNTASAWQFIGEAIGNRSLWRTPDDTVREALRRLLDHTLEPFDTVRNRLSGQDFGSIPVRTGEPVPAGTAVVRWINDSTFAVDPQGWNTDLYLKKVPKLVYPVDFSTLTLSDSILDENGMLDSALFTPDTILVNVIDTAAARSLEIRIHRWKENRASPPLAEQGRDTSARFSDDRSHVLYYIPGTSWTADVTSPFNIVKGRHHLDSLQEAVNTLLGFTMQRDSTRILINDMYGKKTPLWITSGTGDATRFWVKNYKSDSITLWIGNPGKDEISLVLEDEVSFSRLVREEISHLPAFIVEPKRNLLPMTLLEPLPIFWDYELSSDFSMNQTYLANWTKGGESSFSFMMDIQGQATYNNKDANTQWITRSRLKFGTIINGEEGFRKNHDLFEVDSKFNRNAWGVIGMSASFYMKHQLAKGYDYPNDSVAVSKFLNPGTITVGIGAEYKPFTKTTINIAPLSYKTTFVLDTANIDQTKHGINPDQRSKRELGTQIVFYNTISPVKGMEISNRLRLFSNYMNNPQNIDVDWEMILDQMINWFFSIRLNLELIYDDDVRFTLYDPNELPILNPDGSEKKVPKTQFKEFIGLSLKFQF